MLPNLHHQRYQEFKQALEQMQLSLATDADLDVPKLQQRFLLGQQFFQQQIVNLDFGDLNPGDQPRVQSYQTEMSKQLRLLGMDVMFLQAARQPQTALDRLMALERRLETLIGYCDAVLQGSGEWGVGSGEE